MRVPDEVRKCACFVGYKTHDGKELVAGTAFFMLRQIDGTDGGFSYLVTARHVIDGIRSLGLDRVLLRLNMKSTNQAQWFDSAISDWMCHPSDATVDVSVLRMTMERACDHLAIPFVGAATAQAIVGADIGVGTEVFLTGLFQHHYGRNRNIPIVRIGNIAAMPEEQLNLTAGPIDAYLIESRSLGGLSGSPVFATTDPVVRTADGLSAPKGGTYLLGLVHGHYDDPAPQPSASMAVDAASAAARINVGIAVVVPVEKILEVLNQPRIRDAEIPLENELRAELMPTPD